MRIVTFGETQTGSPDSPEWHAWRAMGIGGSDAGVIAVHAGLIPEGAKWFKSAHQLWEIKSGQKEDGFKGNWATERGRQGEDPIRRIYEDQTGCLVAPMFGEMEAWRVCRSSFDGVTFDGSVITEIKCPGKDVHAMAKDNKIVPYYRPQVAHQGLTAWGHPDYWNPDHEIHFVSGIPEKKDVAIVRVEARRVREFAKRLFDAEQDFWRHVVEGRILAGEDFIPLAQAWADAKRALEDAKELEEKAKAAMVQYAEARNERRLEYDGVSLAREERRGAVDYKKVLESKLEAVNDSELDEFRRAGSVSWTPRLSAAAA